MFNRLIRAVFNRSALLGGGGPEPSLSCEYVPESALSTIQAEAAEFWRFSADGTPFYRVTASEIAADDDFDGDDWGYDAEDFDDDDY